MIAITLLADVAARSATPSARRSLYELLRPTPRQRGHRRSGRCASARPPLPGAAGMTLGRREEAVAQLRRAVERNASLRRRRARPHPARSARGRWARGRGRGADRAAEARAASAGCRWWRGGRAAARTFRLKRPQRAVARARLRSACEGATLRPLWPRHWSSPRSRPSGATSRGCCRARSQEGARARNTSRAPTTSSPGRSGTSCSSPTPTSTTSSSRSGGWRTCRSSPSASSWSSATSAPRSR